MVDIISENACLVKEFDSIISRQDTMPTFALKGQLHEIPIKIGEDVKSLRIKKMLVLVCYIFLVLLLLFYSNLELRTLLFLLNFIERKRIDYEVENLTLNNSIH